METIVGKIRKAINSVTQPSRWSYWGGDTSNKSILPLVGGFSTREGWSGIRLHFLPSCEIKARNFTLEVAEAVREIADDLGWLDEYRKMVREFETLKVDRSELKKSLDALHAEERDCRDTARLDEITSEAGTLQARIATRTRTLQAIAAKIGPARNEIVDLVENQVTAVWKESRKKAIKELEDLGSEVSKLIAEHLTKCAAILWGASPQFPDHQTVRTACGRHIAPPLPDLNL